MRRHQGSGCEGRVPSAVGRKFARQEVWREGQETVRSADVGIRHGQPREPKGLEHGWCTTESIARDGDGQPVGQGRGLSGGIRELGARRSRTSHAKGRGGIRLRGCGSGAQCGGSGGGWSRDSQERDPAAGQGAETTECKCGCDGGARSFARSEDPPVVPLGDWLVDFTTIVVPTRAGTIPRPMPAAPDVGALMDKAWIGAAANGAAGWGAEIAADGPTCWAVSLGES